MRVICKVKHMKSCIYFQTSSLQEFTQGFISLQRTSRITLNLTLHPSNMVPFVTISLSRLTSLLLKAPIVVVVFFSWMFTSMVCKVFLKGSITTLVDFLSSPCTMILISQFTHFFCLLVIYMGFMVCDERH